MFINEVSLNFISDSSSVLVINWVMIRVNKDVNEKLKFKGSYLVVKNILFILYFSYYLEVMILIYFELY